MATDLATLKALANAATKGEWTTRPCAGGGVILARPGDKQPLQVYPAEDAAYIVAAQPKAILALLDEIERLERGLRNTACALENLHALVLGEAPSLLENDLQAELIQASREAAAALAGDRHD